MASKKERLEALEKIITASSVILTNKQDPTEKVIISFDGELKFAKVTTTETEEVLSMTTGL